MMTSKIMRKNYKYGRSFTSAFTLIELLVVIALTVILLTILFAPLIQAFQFTEQAQATAEAQDAARQTTEELSRELGSAVAVRDTTGNYLDLPLLNQNGIQIIARAYNAYVDIIPPKAIGTIIDPTVSRTEPTASINQSITGTTGGPSGLSGPNVGLPLSAGTTVIRWFIGLRYPVDPRYTLGSPTFADPQPYSNVFDGLKVSSQDASLFSSYSVQQGLNNTYQLYRANFEPYKLANGSYVVNSDLFATTASGTPAYDDPDFFRIVTTNDPDLLTDPTGKTMFTPALAQAHNDRVYNWFKISKEVIATRDIDLVGLPRAGKNIVYDSHGNPVDSYVTDPGASAPDFAEPIVRTTVNFAPALISNDPMAATNNSNISQGYGEDPTDSSSLPYLPTVYQSQYGNWQGIPAVTITKSASAIYQTRDLTAADGTLSLASPNYSYPSQQNAAIGDLVLASVPSGSPAGTPGTAVYDITAGAPISGAASYDALTVDWNRGQVNFALPALPTANLASYPVNPYFTVPPTALAGTAFNIYTKNPDPNVLNLGDYTLLPGTPLPTPNSAVYTAGGGATASVVPNATLVVNSERIVGPDLAAGIVGSAPGTDMVQYTRVPFGTTPTQPDTYEINYATNDITFPANAVPTTVQVAFSYQNNSSVIGTTATPDMLRASYYTAAIMRLNLGVRVYGSANSASEYFSLNSQVGVGNSKAN